MIERFAGAGVPKENISFVRDTYTFNHQETPSDFVAVLQDYYGPTMNAFEAAAKHGRRARSKRSSRISSSVRTMEQTGPRRFRRHSCE